MTNKDLYSSLPQICFSPSLVSSLGNQLVPDNDIQWRITIARVSGDISCYIISRRVHSVIVCRVLIQEDLSLKIERVRLADEGIYVCHAKNSVGSIEAEAKLTVHCKLYHFSVPISWKG